MLFGMAMAPTHTSKYQLTSSLNHFLIDVIFFSLLFEPYKIKPLTSLIFKLNQGPDRTSLGALNIQRGRDHGLRRYIDYRKLAGGDCPKIWDDINNFQRKCIENLQANQAYKSPNDIDLWIGLICEKPEDDFLLAETQRCKKFVYYLKVN